MAIVLPIKPKVIDKRLAVTEYFERCYKVIFKKRLTDEQVEYLYDQMRELPRSLQRERERLGSKVRFLEDTQPQSS